MGQHTMAVAVAVLLTVAAVPVAGFAATTGAAPSADQSDNASVAGNASETAPAPGVRLSGSVGVHGAGLSGELDRRAFGVALAGAADTEERAAVVASGLGDVERRIEALERRNESLARARSNGSLSESAYRARVAQLATRMAVAESLANATARAAGDLPADRLAEKGVDAADVRRLRERASELGGQRVAEIARGFEPGDRPGRARPGGPPGTDPGAGGPPGRDRPEGGRPTGSGGAA